MKRLTVVKAVPTFSPARPENEVARMIRSYGDARGLDTSRNTFVPLDTDRSRRIADAYEAMRHDPHHPDVVRSMASLKGQLEEQYEHALRHGYRFTPWTHEGQPYANSNEMMDDVLGNRHLYFFKTDSGFGSSEFDASDNPLLTESPFVVGGHRLLHNDVLRAVHDLYGHAAHGHQFGPIGEDRAWHAHLQMFHPDALPSLTTETRGQNSWVNFGPHLRRPDGSLPAKGDPDFLHPSVRPFADQKTGILPAFALQSHWDAHPEWVGKGMPFRPEMTDLKRRLQAGPDVSDWLHLLPEFMGERGVRGQGGSPEAEYQALSEGRKGAFFRWLEDHPETRYGARLSEYGAPPSNTLQYKRIDRPGWSIHFTDNAPGVARHGFLYGHPSYEGVHITTGKPDADRMAAPGYNFAFRLDGSAAKELNHHAPGNGYGVDAVVFPSGGLTAYHLSDDETQHVFHGPSVDPMHVHAIQRTGGRVDDALEWKVVDAMGRHRFTGKLPAAVQHVVDNHEQLARAKVRAWGRIDPAFATYRAPEVWSSRGPRPGRLTKGLLTVVKAAGLTAKQKAEKFGVNESDSYCPDCGAVYEWGDGKCNRCGSSEKPVEYKGKSAEKAMPFRHEVSELARTLKDDTASAYDYSYLLPEYFEHQHGISPEDVPAHLGIAHDSEEFEWPEHMSDQEHKRFSDWMHRYHDEELSGYDAPPGITMPFKSYEKPQWQVHFTNDASSIGRRGFEYGHPETHGVHLTTWKRNRNSEPGYNFSFPVGSRDASRQAHHGGYGREAVVFPAGGLSATHYGDQETQHVVWGPSVDPMHIHPITQGDEGWEVWDAAGNKRFAGEFEDAVHHVVANHEQLGRAKVKAWGKYPGVSLPSWHPGFRNYRSPEIWSSAGPKPGKLTKSLLTIVKAHLPSAALRQRIAAERKRVDLSPTDAEKEAGNYSKGHIPWKGFRIAIENPKGTRRKGKGWLSPPLPCDYGQFVGEKPGNDGDAVDVLIGPHPESEVIFVVNQMKYPDMKELDEHKVLVGFRSAREAKAAYLGCYKPGWKCGPIGTITLDQFKAWMKDGDRSKPVTPATP